MSLLERTRAIVASQGDRNWIRRIENALAEWDADNHDQARLIYRSMVAGGGGFYEYNIWIDEYGQRIAANHELDVMWRAINDDGIS